MRQIMLAFTTDFDSLLSDQLEKNKRSLTGQVRLLLEVFDNLKKISDSAPEAQEEMQKIEEKIRCIAETYRDPARTVKKAIKVEDDEFWNCKKLAAEHKTQSPSLLSALLEYWVEHQKPLTRVAGC